MDILPIVTPPNIPEIGSIGNGLLPEISALFDYSLDEYSLNTNTFIISGNSDQVLLGDDVTFADTFPSVPQSAIPLTSTLGGVVPASLQIQRIKDSTNVSLYEVNITNININTVTLSSPISTLFEIGDIISQGNIVKKILTITSGNIITVDNSISAMAIGIAYLTKINYSPQSLPQKYKTKIVYVPNFPLQANTKYTGIISSNIYLKSFGDLNPITTTQGYWPLVKGRYTRSGTNTYTITIVDSGDKDSASFRWLRSSDNYESDPIKVKYVQGKDFVLDRGLILDFPLFNLNNDPAEYISGDSWTISAYQADGLDNIFSWSFETGDGGVLVPESEVSTYVKEVTVNSIPFSQGNNIGTGYNPNGEFLQIIAMTPRMGESSTPSEIKIYFNKPIDPDSITTDNIKAFLEYFDFSLSNFSERGEQITLTNTSFSVSDTILTITLP